MYIILVEEGFLMPSMANTGIYFFSPSPLYDARVNARDVQEAPPSSKLSHREECDMATVGKVPK